VDSQGNKFCFVNVDICGTFQSIKLSVVQKVKQVLPQSGLDESNIVISSIHTHSGPGGDSWRILYNFTVEGFDADGLAQVVDGIVGAIQQAEQGIRHGCRVFVAEGTISDIHINRSPEAYMNNPDYERAQ